MGTGGVARLRLILQPDAEPHQDYRNLSPGGISGRRKGIRSGSQDHARANGPGECLAGIGGYHVRVPELREICGLLASSAAFPDYVAVQDGRQLLAGNEGVRPERTVVISGDDTVLRGPCHRRAAVGGFRQIGKHSRCRGWLSLHTVEDGDDHASGGRPLGRECRFAGPVHQAVLIDKLHRVIIPVAACHVAE